MTKNFYPLTKMCVCWNQQYIFRPLFTTTKNFLNIRNDQLHFKMHCSRNQWLARVGHNWEHSSWWQSNCSTPVPFKILYCTNFPSHIGGWIDKYYSIFSTLIALMNNFKMLNGMVLLNHCETTKFITVIWFNSYKGGGHSYFKVFKA